MKNKEDVIIVRKGEKIKSAKLKGGAHFDLLFKNETLEVTLGIFKPGDYIEDVYSHEGQEIHIILEGEAEIEVENKKYLLKEGDIIWYPSTKLHTFRNKSKKTLKFYSIVVPPSFM